MSNVKKNAGSATEAQKAKATEEVKEHLKTPPTREEVALWTQRDIDSAIYFLNVIRRHPTIVKQIADELYDYHANGVPNLNKNG